MPADTSPRVHLKAEREKAVRRRHPWIFSGAIDRLTGKPAAGDVVTVTSESGEFMARAAYSPASQIRLRVWSFDESDSVDDDFVHRRVAAAIDRRRNSGLVNGNGACRLIFSEADGLPGLVVDRYGSHLVCQFLAAAIEPWRDTVVRALEALLEPRGIFERSEAGMRRKEGLRSRRGTLAGEPPPPRLEIEGGGLRQLVDLEHGQKTGTYLDQRINRTRVAAYASGADVLDAYAYAGAFGHRCLLGGATHATLLDSSAQALGLAAEQATLNGIDDRCSQIECDVPQRLRALRAEGRRFDLVVLDPPKFVHAAAQVTAGCRAYKDVNRLAFELLAPGGVLATFSCSSHVDALLLQKVVAQAATEAGRNAQILERLAQPPDHPVGLHFPESEYLKGLILRVVD